MKPFKNRHLKHHATIHPRSVCHPGTFWDIGDDHVQHTRVLCVVLRVVRVLCLCVIEMHTTSISPILRRLAVRPRSPFALEMHTVLFDIERNQMKNGSHTPKLTFVWQMKNIDNTLVHISGT